jgi:hypothetical protein
MDKAGFEEFVVAVRDKLRPHASQEFVLGFENLIAHSLM